ncbi:LPS kinase [Streptomyces purpurascens]
MVRYSRAGDEVIAVKELAARPAQREYDMLRDLDRLGIPSVDPLAVVTGRTAADGAPLESVLVTRHLGGSMPYRSMFETTMRPATMHRLMDALAVLLVRLHLAGFAWGDCSLSNTLFRRDAGAYAAYLVDAETGDLHPQLSVGQREYDLDLARVNISGELLDLEASGALHPSVDPIEFGMEMVPATAACGTN